jgi:hypothetical protein
MLQAPLARNIHILQPFLMLFNNSNLLFQEHQFLSGILHLFFPSTVFFVPGAPVLPGICVGARFISKSTDVPCLNKKYATYTLHPGHTTTWGLPGLTGHLPLGRAPPEPKVTQNTLCFLHTVFTRILFAFLLVHSFYRLFGWSKTSGFIVFALFAPLPGHTFPLNLPFLQCSRHLLPGTYTFYNLF